ncbi:MAG: hypothetical protein P1P89_04610 [Desulfobacterales bacterium]|nr:hypothetical protein [Desulfobacterales bacterium]
MVIDQRIPLLNLQTRFQACQHALGLADADTLSNVSLVLSVMVMWMAPAVFAQSPADIEAAKRQLEIIQRQEQERLRRDQEEASRRSKPSEPTDTKPL